MSQGMKVGIIGGGWPGQAHARGYLEAGGFSLVGVADLIPQRREAIAGQNVKCRQYNDASELLADKEIEAVSICLPTHLHLPIALAAFKAGKHVMMESPPALSVKQVKQLAAAAAKRGKVVCYAMQRRFGGAELAAHQAIEKGYAGVPIHSRATWMRTRGIPAGTGWYTEKSQSGGGAMMDLGLHMLDIGWHLLGRPAPKSVFAMTRQQFKELSAKPETNDVEDSAFALLQFEEGKSLELAVSWAINQSPAQNGTTCRVHGSTGAVEVYTPSGPVLYRAFNPKGEAKPTPLKQPKVTGHAAMLRHFRECIKNNASPNPDNAQIILLMRMIESLYRSAASGKSVSF